MEETKEETPTLYPSAPSRQSIDLTRTHLREIDRLPSQTIAPDEEAANNLDAPAIAEERQRWQNSIRHFIDACPLRLRTVLIDWLPRQDRITKTALAKAAGISRPTLDHWLHQAALETWGTARPPFGRIAI